MLIFLTFLYGYLFVVHLGSKLSVTDLYNGETYVMMGPNRFCYDNSIVPSWRHTWTTVQVAHMHFAPLFSLSWHNLNPSN